ncbi:uncharacterized protein LOC143910236 [Arctopsyche grandis]|uniref:uncharacterized protein LOC143910236 n=1 Tax=Arctopsyche grandis TaxID=121162 RepID=UPI00406D8194
MAGEPNGNVGKSNFLSAGPRPHGSSNEDLSEYTDADESVSAPTEFLSEFLSSLMLKDYTTALKYCKLILHYEPNNATAREFYPLILEKLEKLSPSEDENSNTHSTSSEDDAEPKSSHSDTEPDTESDDGESSEGEKENEQISLEQSFEENIIGLDSSVGLDNSTELDNSGGIEKLCDLDIRSSKSLSPRIDSDGTTNSYSSLEDEEVLTRDEPTLEEVVIHGGLIDDNNGNTIVYASTNVTSTSDHSNFNWFTKRKDQNKNTISHTVQMSSDSESPTDPVTQQTVEMLRSKFVLQPIK